MIDTITYRQEFRLKHDLGTGLKTVDAHSDFKVRVKTSKIVKGNKIVEESKITWVSVSLPKLLFGRNTKLIESQQQLDAAFALVEEKLLSFGATVASGREFTRVDLVWQFKHRPIPFFLALAPCNHPEILAEAGMFRNRHFPTGVWWKAAPAQGKRKKTAPLLIRMYSVTSGKRPPVQVVRIEVELRLRKLREKLNPNRDKRQPVTALDFHQCYSAYRETLLRFVPKKVPRVNHKEDVLAYLEQKHGIKVFALLAQAGASRTTLYRLRQRAASGLPRNFRISLKRMLPAGRLPLAADPEFRPKVRIR